MEGVEGGVRLSDIDDCDEKFWMLLLICLGEELCKELSFGWMVEDGEGVFVTLSQESQ